MLCVPAPPLAIQPDDLRLYPWPLAQAARVLVPGPLEFVYAQLAPTSSLFRRLVVAPGLEAPVQYLLLFALDTCFLACYPHLWDSRLLTLAAAADHCANVLAWWCRCLPRSADYWHGTYLHLEQAKFTALLLAALLRAPRWVRNAATPAAPPPSESN